MEIQTKYLGTIEVEEKQIIRFPQGLPAFEDHRQFVFLPFDDRGIFFYMQSVTDEELCLIVCDPFCFFPEYQIDLGDHECQQLGIEDASDVAVFTILTIPDNFREATANLLAPVVINIRTNLGLQFIPTDSDYNTKEYIFPGIHKNVAAGEGK